MVFSSFKLNLHAIIDRSNDSLKILIEDGHLQFKIGGRFSLFEFGYSLYERLKVLEKHFFIFMKFALSKPISTHFSTFVINDRSRDSKLLNDIRQHCVLGVFLVEILALLGLVSLHLHKHYHQLIDYLIVLLPAGEFGVDFRQNFGKMFKSVD